eukprot:scaffold4394_cov113-Isochrysis_galbana.AAC.23
MPPVPPAGERAGRGRGGGDCLRSGPHLPARRLLRRRAGGKRGCLFRLLTCVSQRKGDVVVVEHCKSSRCRERRLQARGGGARRLRRRVVERTNKDAENVKAKQRRRRKGRGATRDDRGRDDEYASKASTGKQQTQTPQTPVHTHLTGIERRRLTPINIHETCNRGKRMCLCRVCQE